ncbi:MAG: DUF3786 domain-containing protein [Desulfobacteraceae bacterium]
MPLSVVDLYTQVLPRTNCRDCGHPTCLAFASMVVSERLPLAACPHLSPQTVARYQPILDAQHAQGKWTKRDPAADALQWARERSAGMRPEDLPARIGGRLVRTADGQPALELPYFTDTVLIRPDGIQKKDGTPLNRWEQVFIYNHLAQGGSALPAEDWRGLEQIPNTVSKIKSMQRHVEAPLVARFRGRLAALAAAARALGAKEVTGRVGSADAAFRFQPLPRIPLLLLFWEESPADGLAAGVKLLFDATITEHLDIESILFLSERLRQLLCGEGNDR